MNKVPETLVDRAADLIARRLPRARKAGLAIVSGSGLGVLTELGREAAGLEFDEIPGLGRGAVAGHAGRWLLLDTSAGPVHLLAGRRHFYEGIEPAVPGFAVRALARLGVARLILTNAAGGLSPRLAVGDLMLIRDHLNLMFFSPLPAGATPSPCGSEIYDPVLSEALRAAAQAEGIALQEGIYAGLCGPSYETRAEVALLRRLGADAVGMSTVPEALTARATGMRVATVSLITNSHVAGGNPPTHEEVLEAGRRSGRRLKTVLARALEGFNR